MGLLLRKWHSSNFKWYLASTYADAVITISIPMLIVSSVDRTSVFPESLTRVSHTYTYYIITLAANDKQFSIRMHSPRTTISVINLFHHNQPPSEWRSVARFRKLHHSSYTTATYCPNSENHSAARVIARTCIKPAVIFSLFSKRKKMRLYYPRSFEIRCWLLRSFSSANTVNKLWAPRNSKLIKSFARCQQIPLTTQCESYRR